ncbi:hypothetical protein [Nannocystis radixulma]|uniref:Uncharacterized protein n=1 Tax=Nannocystis radixulma TaxID=2995305 RepID=A0ABT5BF90_9BACT|nr:hypothetical protein [Nannocystis radixulma]MDC0672747.1 hypothetical protein [Nannocystis radixulma]
MSSTISPAHPTGAPVVVSSVVVVGVVVDVDVVVVVGADVVEVVVEVDVEFVPVSLSLPPGLGPQATSRPRSENSERRAGAMFVSSKLEAITGVEPAPPHPSSDRRDAPGRGSEARSCSDRASERLDSSAIPS